MCQGSDYEKASETNDWRILAKLKKTQKKKDFLSYLLNFKAVYEMSPRILL